MNTFTKIVATTLPLVFCMLLVTVGIMYHFSRAALTDLAETWLDTRLAEAMKVAAHQDAVLHQYGLAQIPASISKAKLDASQIIATIDVGETGHIFAVDAGGKIVMHPDAAMLGRDVGDTPWFAKIRKEPGRLLYRGPQGRNVAMVDYFAPWEWYIIASNPQQEVFGVANGMIPYLIGFGVIGFMTIAGVLLVLTRRMAQPLRMLTVGAEKIGRGKLDTRIAIRSRDEFSRLARVFNQMADQLQETLTALQNREAYFRSLIEHASDLITILDKDARILYSSPSIERLFGYPMASLLGRRVFDFIHPEDREQAMALFDQRIENNAAGSPSELRVQHLDGHWVTVETVSNNLLDNPAVRGLVINARDISKRKAAEKALKRSHHQLEARVAERTAELFKINAMLKEEVEERQQTVRENKQLQDQLFQAQKMEAVGTLAGGVAHDFNNLLMGIQGNVDMLMLDGELEGQQLERLNTIANCVASGSRLTQQMLGFARMGKYQVQPSDPNRLLKKSAEMFGRTRQELRIQLDCQEDVAAVNVDRGQIEQVLLNLFINAWQAMPDGGTLYLASANEALNHYQASAHQVSPGNYIKMTVTDTGIGMEKATLERIFDPFFTTKSMTRGTGLGLASAYGIVRNHGGFIDVHSEVNNGTTFEIYLKALDDPSVPESENPSNTPCTGNETVLLVDDDALIINVGRTMLRVLGYQVLTADSGKEAIAVYRERGDQIDLVILDMIMPDMGGGSTFDALKEIDPDVAVLLSSGYSIDGQASEILHRGCSGFLQKPFNLKKLSEKVRAVLDLPRVKYVDANAEHGSAPENSVRIAT